MSQSAKTKLEDFADRQSLNSRARYKERKMNMKLTRGLVLGSALGMAAMAMLNKQAQSNSANKAAGSSLNSQSNTSVGINTSLGHISYDSNDKKYNGYTSSASHSGSGSTSANDPVITDILK